jgi:hypothetical protein
MTLQFAFPEPDWPTDDESLRLYLPNLISGPGAIDEAPATEVQATAGSFARTLRIDLEPGEFDPGELDPDPPHHDASKADLTPVPGVVASLPLFDERAASQRTHAPEWVLSAALRLLRPGFFGLTEVPTQQRTALRVVATEPRRPRHLRGRTSLELDLPPAREDLVVALARVLRATGAGAGIAQVTVDELRALTANTKRRESLSLDEQLPLVPLPFEWSVDHEERETFTVEIDFQRNLDDEARATLTDRSRAFVAMLQLGLLPGPSAIETPMGTLSAGTHGYAALTEATDSLPDQWTLALEDFAADLSCIHPFLESLALLHQRWAIAEVTLVC